MSGERLALVTGTSSGIGAAIARQLLDRGWQVIGVARRTPRLAAAHYRHLALDLADAAKASAALEREFGARLVERAWERVGLVNNAAVAPAGRTRNVDAVELARAFTLNVAMPLWLIGMLVRRRPGQAQLRVVNISSGAAHRTVAGLAAYCASKAALHMAGACVAAEEEPGLAIYSYQPGVVDTVMQREAREMPLEEFPSGVMFRQYHAEGRLAAPDLPAADVVKFLETERAERFVEGRRT
jgi:benzil reductase ((S)-benzoin forming)